VELNCNLIGQTQAYLESFSQLINPSAYQQRQIASRTSALWSNLRINAQRAAGMLFYNQQLLLMAGAGENEAFDAAHQQNLIDELKFALLNLVVASNACDTPRCLVLIQAGLNTLHGLAVALADSKLSADRRTYPGRVKVRMTFRLLGRRPDTVTQGDYRYTLPGAASAASAEREILLVVDGLNYPGTARAFLDLCRRDFYDNLPVAHLPVEVGGSNVSLPAMILGNYAPGRVDTVTGKQARVPLEILREQPLTGNNGTASTGASIDEDSVGVVVTDGAGRRRRWRRFTTLGAARNSAVFTRAKPVQSFSAVRAASLCCLFYASNTPAMR
jgi:hypothetical protein